MEVKEILSKCDHTLLAQTATWKEIRAICDDGMKSVSYTHLKRGKTVRAARN